MELKIIARIHTDFSSRFGIPRQSGLVNSLLAKIVFEKPYRNPDAIRGLEGFSYLWLLWEFSECVREEWQPMVRPPKMDLNSKMGVFATRSPYRPNPIGLSSVQIERVENNEVEGPVIWVRGADLLDGTPIYDIKPYLAYADSHPEALSGFATPYIGKTLQVEMTDMQLSVIPPDKREALLQLLGQDPRPAYTKFPERVFGMEFAGFDIRFQVNEQEKIVCVTEIHPII